MKIKLKKGDRVMTTERSVNGSSTPKGATGTVIGILGSLSEFCVEFDEAMGGHDGNSVMDGVRGKKGHCWWFDYSHADKFEIIPAQRIVITTYGKETLARLYDGDKVVKTATAKCSAEDTFDFETGARIAFDRLVAKYHAGDKVKVIANTCCHYAKIGEVVTLKNVCDQRNDEGKTTWYIDEHYGYIAERDFEPCGVEEPKYYNGKVVCVEKDKYAAYTVGKIYEFKDGRVMIDNHCKIPVGRRITTLEEWNKNEGLYCKFIPLVE